MGSKNNIGTSSPSLTSIEMPMKRLSSVMSFT